MRRPRAQERPWFLNFCLCIISGVQIVFQAPHHTAVDAAFVVSSSQQQQFAFLHRRCGWDRPSSVATTVAAAAASFAATRRHQDPLWEDDEEEDLAYASAKAELWDEDQDDEEAWVSDQEKARRQKKDVSPIPPPLAAAAAAAEPAAVITATTKLPRTVRGSKQNSKQKSGDGQQEQENNEQVKNARSRSQLDPNRPSSPYTDEEEEIISAMGGGGTATRIRKREPGFLGDSTLQEICYDYSVPISYVADVLCMWGVPVPIHVHDRLGDLVTGEQAFAILEAVYTLDVAALQDRYSNQNLLHVCESFDIPIKDAFEMAVKEGWSLPFGVQTCLRVEQEEELLRTLGNGIVVE